MNRVSPAKKSDAAITVLTTIGYYEKDEGGYRVSKKVKELEAAGFSERQIERMLLEEQRTKLEHLVAYVASLPDKAIEARAAKEALLNQDRTIWEACAAMGYGWKSVFTEKWHNPIEIDELSVAAAKPPSLN